MPVVDAMRCSSHPGLLGGVGVPRLGPSVVMGCGGLAVVAGGAVDDPLDLIEMQMEALDGRTSQAGRRPGLR